MIDLAETLEETIQWARDCGAILNSHLIDSYQRPIKILDKGTEGLATEADMLSEALVMRKIRERYPDHLILSEEDAFAKKLKLDGVGADQYLWLIDPLDGTNNFYNRVPFFSVSLAVSRGLQTQVGVVFNPVSNELFYATRGGGAFLVRQVGKEEVRIRLKASHVKKGFNEALLSANLTSKRVEKDLLKSFPEVRAMRRFGSAALELSYVAAGMLDAYWEYRLKPWDMAAAGLICEEAGVRISNVKGEEFTPFVSSVLACTPPLYGDLMSVLNK